MAACSGMWGERVCLACRVAGEKKLVMLVSCPQLSCQQTPWLLFCWRRSRRRAPPAQPPHNRHANRTLTARLPEVLLAARRTAAAAEHITTGPGDPIASTLSPMSHQAGTPLDAPAAPLPPPLHDGFISSAVATLEHTADELEARMPFGATLLGAAAGLLGLIVLVALVLCVWVAWRAWQRHMGRAMAWRGTPIPPESPHGSPRLGASSGPDSDDDSANDEDDDIERRRGGRHTGARANGRTGHDAGCTRAREDSEVECGPDGPSTAGGGSGARPGKQMVFVIIGDDYYRKMTRLRATQLPELHAALQELFAEELGGAGDERRGEPNGEGTHTSLHVGQMELQFLDECARAPCAHHAPTMHHALTMPHVAPRTPHLSPDATHRSPPCTPPFTLPLHPLYSLDLSSQRARLLLFAALVAAEHSSLLAPEPLASLGICTAPSPPPVPLCA